MNRFKIRLGTSSGTSTGARAGRAAVVALAVLATMLSGCSAGQVSQTAMQEPAVNGSKANVKNVLLRDVRIQAEQKEDFIQPGRTVELVLVVVNESPDQPDRLTSITSDGGIGTVTLSGDPRLLPGRMLFIGKPEGQNVAPGPIQGNTAAKASLQLTKPISNGLTYRFTFNFEKAGQATVEVPISAGLSAHRESS